MTATQRFAVYYAPRPDDPLASAGAAWLGRDPETNTRITGPDLPGLANVTAEARRYGFHATLKPPMRLAPGRTWFALRDATERLAGSLPAFDLPPLGVAGVGGSWHSARRRPALRCERWPMQR